MHIFVINLERASERRRQILAHLQGLGLEAEILPAIEGARLSPAELPTGTHPELSPGEIGCYLSHVRFWQEVVQRNLDFAVVLEDDVRCSPDMLRVIHDSIASGLPFDALRLSALRPIRGEELLRLPGGGRVVLPSKNPSGTQGYLLSQAGARRLLRALAVPRCPIDDALDQYWRHDLWIPVVQPSVVEEDPALASTIEGRFGSGEVQTLGRHLARVVVAERRKWTVRWMALRLRRRLAEKGRGAAPS